MSDAGSVSFAEVSLWFYDTFTQTCERLPVQREWKNGKGRKYDEKVLDKCLQE